MTLPMTGEKIAELEALLKTASARPWTLETSSEPAIVHVGGGDAAYVEDDLGITPTRERESNARLIVAAVNALPTLLSRIKELEAERERMREALEPFAEEADCFECEFYPDERVVPLFSFTYGDLRAARAALAQGLRETSAESAG